MRNLKLSALALAIGMTAAACASSGGSAGATQSGAQRTSRSQNLITQAELDATDATDAYQAIQRLRPQMLQPKRGPTTMAAGTTQGGGASADEIQVYVDDQRFGTISALSSIPKTEIKEIRWLSASEATQRFGTGNAAGAILLTRRTSK